MSKTLDKKMEELSDYAHSAWAGWMKYLFEKSTKNTDGSVTIPSELVERWERQVNTEYDFLSELEKDSDRKEAIRMLNIMIGK